MRSMSLRLVRFEIRFQSVSNFTPRVHLIFLIFVTNKLLGAKTKKSKSN